MIILILFKKKNIFRMDLSQLSEFELHQLIDRINGELSHRRHVQMFSSQPSESRVVQVVFKPGPGIVDDILENLRVYGTLERHKRETNEGLTTMTVYYTDPRDADDAVKKLRDQYRISLLAHPPVYKPGVVQVLVRNDVEAIASVNRDLDLYGWIISSQVVPDGKQLTIKITYEDIRDAKEAVGGLRHRYDITLVDGETVKS